MDPAGWAVLETDLVAVVIGMPLAKLQRFGEGQRSVEDRFIYEFSWREEIGRAAVAKPGFDDSPRLRPGVGGWLVRLAPLIRPLVQAKWASMVAARNADLVDAERLNEFLFGATGQPGQGSRPARRGAEPGMLLLFRSASAKHGRRSLPWSRHPDNSLDNLVAAHTACNSAKSSSLAGVGHLRQWVERFADTEANLRLETVKLSTGWHRRPDRVLATARATYLWLPEGTRLWREKLVFDRLDPAEVRALLGAVN